MQRSRRQDPYPLTYEVPLALTVAVLLVLVLGAHVGRAVANVLAGRAWALPLREEVFVSLPGLLRGDPAAGLAGGPGPWASEHLLVGCLVTTEVVVTIALVWVGKHALDRWGPDRLRGVASVGEVERLLGRSRLRAHRAVIRPDLYSRRGTRAGTKSPLSDVPPGPGTPATAAAVAAGRGLGAGGGWV